MELLPSCVFSANVPTCTCCGLAYPSDSYYNSKPNQAHMLPHMERNHMFRQSTCDRCPWETALGESFPKHRLSHPVTLSHGMFYAQCLERIVCHTFASFWCSGIRGVLLINVESKKLNQNSPDEISWRWEQHWRDNQGNLSFFMWK